MIAIYRANQQAFDGNINQLRAGRVLRLPDQAAVSSVDPGDAASEVRRQAAAWSGGRAGGSAPEARLRLVPPGSPGAGSGGAETQALRDRVNQLETELAESRRLLELRNAELARLQSSGRNAPAPTAEPPPRRRLRLRPSRRPPPQSPRLPSPQRRAKPAESRRGPEGPIRSAEGFLPVPVGFALLAVLRAAGPSPPRVTA
jgi:pilus assembly protein FimV